MQRFGAYAAAIKPERTFFNVLMVLAGFLYACRWHIGTPLLVYTLLGTSLLIMSGCAANNLTDRGRDIQMPRTKMRGTVTGVVSGRGLFAIALIFGVVGAAILAMHVNMLTCLLGLAAYIDYVVLYAWSKRTTPWSTLIGTPAGSLPLAAGYTAVTNSFDKSALILCLIMVCWQMVHFYAIGIYRLKDYKAGHLPIWPARYGVKSTQQQMLIFTMLYLATVIFLTVFADAGSVFMIVIGGWALYWLYLGVKGLKNRHPEAWARSMFGFSLHTLLLLALGIALAPLLP